MTSDASAAANVASDAGAIGSVRLAHSSREIRKRIAERAPDVLLFFSSRFPADGDELIENAARASEASNRPLIIITDCGFDCVPEPWRERAADFICAPWREGELSLRIQRAIVQTPSNALPSMDADECHDGASEEDYLTRLRAELREQQTKTIVLESMLESAATRDPLTNLLNRRAFMEHLNESLTNATRHRFAVLFIDLDDFKIINDSLGHSFGDALLLEFSARLSACVRIQSEGARKPGDIAARLGGDEFVVLLTDLRDHAEALAVAERILERTSEPFRIRGHSLTVKASIGVAFSDGPGRSAADVLRDADLAMYRAKQTGKAGLAVYSASMHKEVSRRLTLENALRDAIDQEKLHILYQPIVNLGTGRIGSVEALLRWQHPDYGVISPTEFIQIAEETGLIVPLGRWLLNSTCEQLQRWQCDLGMDPRISLNINVSKRQVVYPKFAEELREIIRSNRTDPARLNLEITESTVIDAGDPIARTLHEIKETGVHLHMDDFGTGYSSLSCLHRLPVDCVKIDREFIGAMSIKQSCAAVVHAVIALARNLDLRVTAEGVETESQLVQMLAMDCDNAQGYHFSRAVEAGVILQLIRMSRSWLHTPSGVVTAV